MENTEKINLLNKAFRPLQSQGKVRTQGDFARLLGLSLNSISAAKNGDERYLTDNLVERIQAIMEQSSPVTDTTETVPVLPTEAMAGTLGDFALAVQDYECERMVSPIKGADFAIKILYHPVIYEHSIVNGWKAGLSDTHSTTLSLSVLRICLMTAPFSVSRT